MMPRVRSVQASESPVETTWQGTAKDMNDPGEASVISYGTS